MSIRNQITTYLTKLRVFFSSSKGRDVLLYLFFVGISFIFWVMLTLNNVVQKSYRMKFEITDIPQNITIVSDYPKEISVTIKSTGYSLLKYAYSGQTVLKVKFKDLTSDNNKRLSIRKQDLQDWVVAKFGAGTSVVTLNPEQLSLQYTDQPGKKVKVLVNGDFTTDIQYVVNGDIRTIPDSVTIYADAEALNRLSAVSTRKISRQNLVDSLFVKTQLEKVPNVKYIPDSVNVLVPVEPLVSKKSSIPIVVYNKPKDVNLIVFPSRAQVSYLVPISMYNQNSLEFFQAKVDFNDIYDKTEKLSVRLDNPPAPLRNIRLLTDSVEYIVEH